MVSISFKIKLQDTLQSLTLFGVQYILNGTLQFLEFFHFEYAHFSVKALALYNVLNSWIIFKKYFIKMYCPFSLSVS